MPKKTCRCGESLRYGTIPCELEWLLVSDVAFERCSSAEPEGIDADSLYEVMKSMLQCPNCGRLWIFWNGFDKEPSEYVPTSRSSKPAERDL